MKKIIIGIFFLISILTFSQYNYPFQNPNLATIFGSSTMMIEGVSKKVPVKEYELILKPQKEIPEHFWYNRGFKFSLVPQEKPAPLIFLLAGTGSAYNSIRMENFQRIFYDAGYNVISLSSPMNSNFIINVEEVSMPGLIFDDSKAMYEIMKKTYEKVKDEIQVTDFYLVGYSLGGTEAGMVSFIDEREKVFNFQRVFMINPAVDAYKSALILDKYLDFPPEKRAEKIANMIDNIIDKLVKQSLPEHTKIDIETIYKLFSKENMSDKEMKELIGSAFRLTAMDINYITDVLNSRGIYVKNPKELQKFTPMFDYFKTLNFASFEEYIYKVAYPYYKEKIGEDISLEELLQKARLNYIDEYLKNSSKVVAVTNADELILDNEDIEYLKMTFKDRLIIYPFGGHCGNMFFTPNVKIMLNFLEKGELSNEY